MTTSIREARDRAVSTLDAAGVPDPAVDAELLLGAVLGIGRGELQARVALDGVLAADEEARFDAMLARRAEREPLQHLTGRAPFRALELAVGPGVFVPRPETELAAQFAIDALEAMAVPEPIAVDLGTGSGALALALATEVPRSRVVAVEKSPDAHRWAARNLEEVGADNIRLVLDDLAGALEELNGRVSVVVSNPPYIPEWAVPRDPEVHRFDPPLALYGGEDGLEVVREVSSTALRLLHPGGTVVIEHGEEQGAPITALLEADGWRAIAVHRDLLGRDRVTTALRR